MTGPATGAEGVADPHAARTRGQVSLTVRLVCRDEADLRAVLDHAAAHVAASRAEPGCLQFDMVRVGAAPGDAPAGRAVFAVAERFADEAAYRAHQARTRSSDWGAATRDIPRQDYDRRGVSE